MPLEDFLTPKRPKDAVGALVVLGLILFGFAGFFGFFSAPRAGGSGMGLASAGFAIAGALVISAAVRLYGESPHDRTPP